MSCPIYFLLLSFLTGSFEASGNQANGDKWKAKITYKVIAEVDRPGSGEVLKVSSSNQTKPNQIQSVSLSIRPSFCQSVSQLVSQSVSHD